MAISTPKGLFDILPEPREQWCRSDLWSYLEEEIRTITSQYGYREIRTPIFEKTELFARGVGEGSDIVRKEMYTFEDHGGRLMTLRPEGTAPVMRSFISHGLQQQGSVHKFFYIAPMFRYERQQAGRYRQHHQFGVEAVGQPQAEQDAEVIDLLYTFLGRLGLKGLHLQLNSLGDIKCRQQHRQALVDYLTPRREQLSEESRQRLEVNPLRILDSKSPQDREWVESAPSILDFLEEEAQNHFERLKELLNGMRVPYTVNPHLVRGLDYYNRTVFEVQSSELGAQNSLGGGGRYDSLLALLEGPDLPAIGFGCGLERILQAMIAQGTPLPPPTRPQIFLAPLGERALFFCSVLASELRRRGIRAALNTQGKRVKALLQMANSVNARSILVIGDEELDRGVANWQDLDARTTREVPLSDDARLLADQLLKMELFQ
jgi:histidyl-tRNA synthetase